jgi:hypothetical protein
MYQLGDGAWKRDRLATKEAKATRGTPRAFAKDSIDRFMYFPVEYKVIFPS